MSRALVVCAGALTCFGAVVIGLPALAPPAGMTAAAVQPAGQGTVVRADGLRPLFPDVPPGGYPHDTYTPGNCTWWAAYNRLVPPYLGDGWQWLGNATRAGMPTAVQPSVGAVVVYRASPGYDVVHGHVAIVIAIGATSFRVSEMNFVGLGRIDKRDSPWPDWHVEGFIPR